MLTVNGTRPPWEPAPALTVKTGGVTEVGAASPAGVQQYSFSVPREQLKDGTLRVDLQVNSFKPPGDARQLGIIVTNVTLSPGANPDRFIAPPSGPLLAIVSAVALLSLLLALFGWGPGGVLLGGGSVALLAASLLAFDRLWLTSGRWYWAWPQALIAAGVVALICWPVAGWLLRRAEGCAGRLSRGDHC